MYNYVDGDGNTTNIIEMNEAFTDVEVALPKFKEYILAEQEKRWPEPGPKYHLVVKENVEIEDDDKGVDIARYYIELYDDILLDDGSTRTEKTYSSSFYWIKEIPLI